MITRTRSNFWCDECHEDRQDLIAERAGKVGEEVWKTRCPKCGITLIRHISNARRDPYWKRSKMVQEDARRYWKDLLQPNDPRYSTYYGNPDKAFIEKAEKEERERWEKNKRREISRNTVFT
jgi:ssDNA-binding Zn-finger/Zn-ribbon topoisomerase 1